MSPRLSCTLFLASLALVSGCVGPPKTEQETLPKPIQLTSNFGRAGEAYFSPDMQWIIFQAAPEGQPHYQMYIAPLRYDNNEIVGTGQPIRISPANSRNTCGYFSPDGNSIIFASTAGKEDPGTLEGGYQRTGRDYRWSFPHGMEMYRADGWQAAIAAAEPGRGIDLAKHAITNNDAYDAEGGFSPDGKHIVFGSDRTGDMEVWIMNGDGTNPVQITNRQGYDGGTFFSPDGKKIIYRSDRQSNDLLQVYSADLVFDASGNITGSKNEEQLTKPQPREWKKIAATQPKDASNTGVVNWCPFFDPTGKTIVWASSLQGHTNYELYMMKADGSKKCRITFTPGFDGLPVISPDGKYMMWSAKRAADNSTQVFISKFNMPRYLK